MPSPALGPATAYELEQLAQSYSARSVREAALADNLRRDGLDEAADNNLTRSRVHRRTADILLAYAREVEARVARPATDLQAAE